MTYLTKDNIVYFYSTNIENPIIEGFKVIHFDEHPAKLISIGYDKVIFEYQDTGKTF
jgi:hypothetical protein